MPERKFAGYSGHVSIRTYISQYVSEKKNRELDGHTTITYVYVANASVNMDLIRFRFAVADGGRVKPGFWTSLACDALGSATTNAASNVCFRNMV